MIDGVRLTPLKVHTDERGRVMEILRADDDLFRGFGQLYMTTAYPGKVKAWRAHESRVDSFAVVQGRIKLVLWDGRVSSPTRGQVDEYLLGPENPLLVQVPCQVLHGYQSLGPEEAIVLNCTTVAFDPADPDLVSLEPHTPEVPYRWNQ
jgi:dTDP-4-dehydrorhamnose 3,5-epimerase